MHERRQHDAPKDEICILATSSEGGLVRGHGGSCLVSYQQFPVPERKTLAFAQEAVGADVQCESQVAVELHAVVVCARLVGTHIGCV